MKYETYLQTPYWAKVSALVKKRAGYRCQLCNGTHALEAHHRTYAHRGNELEHIENPRLQQSHAETSPG